MPVTECSDCERPTSVFHGERAYCSRCIVLAMEEEPGAHRCPECKAVQPRTVCWKGDKPCGKCQAAKRRTRR